MISINGTPIPEQAIAAEMQFHPAPTREQAWNEAATALAIRALLLDEAARLGVRETDGEEATTRALLAREVHVPQPDDAACRRYHAANRARFRSPDVYEVAHILFAAPPDDATARARAKVQAEALLAILCEAPQRFADLAREHSACPSAANGGRLGQQSRGDLVPEIETFVMALEEGQICPTPVSSRYGIHVLRLDRRVMGAELPYEVIAETVALRMATQTWQRAVSQYLRILAGRARIEGLALDGATTPLVQ
jgi:peptidyl-prolyl cis-trans isomerase C